MADPFTYDVFLSHNSKDKPRVRALAEKLRAAGLRVWFDEWVIRPGDDIYLAIERGLEAARAQVLCLSPAALGSEWVSLERSTVLFRDPTNSGRRFIPLLLAYCELPDALRRYKYVDYRQEAKVAFAELLAACRSDTESSPPAPKLEPTKTLVSYLPSEILGKEARARLSEAKQRYFDYLFAVCGELELEGLPADQDIGFRRMRLERLFVPLHLEHMPDVKPANVGEPEPHPERRSERSPLPKVTVGEALAQRSRLAILALPGGGKTTLLKRLAIAYAFPDHRSDADDALPDKNWFPLFLRCREIEERATEPVSALLESLGERAELGDLVGDFRALLHSNLQEGKVLLLVDGLDEIANDGKRICFASQLRTFLSSYPTVDVVITSREAGFRVVAGSLGTLCDHFRIANFDREDIERLTLAWFREVVGDRPDVEAQARTLAVAIWETERVRELALNPLLLTTILVVRRWAGEIPSRQTTLYEKAIEVLLRSWNLPGFDPLDLDEVIPQLAFLAWHMMEEGVQRVSGPALYAALRAARLELSDLLSSTKQRVNDLVDHIERRSSLLVLSGREIEGGVLVPVYEFRHLAFQEYLAAKAAVEGYCPAADAADFVSLLEPHFESAAWREVVSLASALAGRRAKALIESILARIEEIRRSKDSDSTRIENMVGLLVGCLLSGAKVDSSLVERSLDSVARNYRTMDNSIEKLALGPHGESYKNVVWRGLTDPDNGADIEALSGAWLTVCLAAYRFENWESLDLAEIELLVASGEAQKRVFGLLVACWQTSVLNVFNCRRRPDRKARLLGRLWRHAVAALRSPHPYERFAGLSALGSFAEEDVLPVEGREVSLAGLIDLWQRTEIPSLRSAASFAIRAFPILPRVSCSLRKPRQWEITKSASALYTDLDAEDSRASRIATLIVAFYWRAPWSDEELIAKIVEILIEKKEKRIVRRRLRKLLRQLGASGRNAVHELDRRKEKLF